MYKVFLNFSDSSSWLSAWLSKTILLVMKAEDSLCHHCKEQHIALDAVAKS